MKLKKGDVDTLAGGPPSVNAEVLAKALRALLAGEAVELTGAGTGGAESWVLALGASAPALLGRLVPGGDLRPLVRQGREPAAHAAPSWLAHRHGVLARAWGAEAAADLADALAGLSAPGLVTAAGLSAPPRATSAPAAWLAKAASPLAADAGLPRLRIGEIAFARRLHEVLIDSRSSARLPTALGVFRICGYVERATGEEHVALVMGDLAGAAPVLARIHSECMTGEVFGSLRCDCRPQLEAAMARVAEAGRGVIVYLRGHEGRGIGLMHKLDAYALQDSGLDTVDANRELGLPVDARDYGVGWQILRDLGVQAVRLMTNNPRKCNALTAFGMKVAERVPIVVARQAENQRYLDAKRERLGHLLTAEGKDRQGPG